VILIGPARRYIIAVLAVALVFCGFASGADDSDDAARQLRIYKTALLRGASEENRVDAAIELLRWGSREAKAALLEALVSGENLEARRAVC